MLWESITPTLQLLSGSGGPYLFWGEGSFCIWELGGTSVALYESPCRCVWVERYHSWSDISEIQSNGFEFGERNIDSAPTPKTARNGAAMGLEDGFRTLFYTGGAVC